MSDPNFDPYHKWLGISPPDQPANHYRLLGIDLFESDPDVIDSASLKQIAYIRTFALGPQSEQSQSLLNEMSAARVTLLDARRKKEYDRGLRSQLQPTAPPRDHSLDQGSAAVAETRQQQGNARAVEQSEEIDAGLAAKQRNRRLYIRLGAAIALVYVIMLSVMLYLRAQGIAEDVSEALRRGDYAAALELDPGNEQARVMKQNAEDLVDALKQRDYQTALHIDPTNAEALAMQKSSDIQQALADGDYTRALTLDPSNAEALAMQKSAEIQQALADGETENSIGMKFKLIPAGKFQMGSNDGSDREKPAHQVTLTKPFMLGTYEVTQAQYQQVMGTNPSRVKGASNPVEMVTWDDAVEFCKRLSALPAERAAGNVYRIPTEAQWEYACRAGTTTKYSFGDDESDLGDYAWFRENSSERTHPVGGKQPNAWGLYDMHGNVFEWCQDPHGAYPDLAVTDPTGAGSGSSRVDRGGSWRGSAVICRSALRSRYSPSYHSSISGFRVSLSPSGKVAASPPPPVEPDIPTQIELPESGNSIGMKFKLIPAGKFQMGSNDGSDREKPAHQVTLTKPFMLGTYEVTQAQYQQVMGTNPSRVKGASNPVEMVTWDDAVEFCKRLSALPAERAAGRVYQLPTEAQWEYACRAGTTTKYSFGDDESDLGDYAWFRENSSESTHPVGGKQPNAWGLYDMHGNVWEWCQDWYEDYPDRAVTDPTGAGTGSYRVSRGGSWFAPAGDCRSAYRNRRKPSIRYRDLGFRVSLSPSGK